MMYAAPTARRQRIGPSRMHTAAAHAKQLGALRLSLSTAVDNASAQALYAANGSLRDEKFFSYQLALQ